MATDRWEEIKTVGWPATADRFELGLKDPLGDTVFQDAQRKKPIGWQEKGWDWGSLLSFRLDFDRMGLAAASGVVSSTCTEGSSQVSHFIP